MLVLVTTVLVLFGAPAVLLWLGRRIERVTGAHIGRNRTAQIVADTTGLEWFFRPLRPMFGDAMPGNPMPAGEQPVVSSITGATVRSTVDQSVDCPWFYHPMKPLFTWPDLSRFRHRLAFWHRRGSFNRQLG